MIFSKNTHKSVARLALVKWYGKVNRAGFQAIISTLTEHHDDAYLSGEP